MRWVELRICCDLSPRIGEGKAGAWRMDMQRNGYAYMGEAGRVGIGSENRGLGANERCGVCDQWCEVRFFSPKHAGLGGFSRGVCEAGVLR